MMEISGDTMVQRALSRLQIRPGFGAKYAGRKVKWQERGQQCKPVRPGRRGWIELYKRGPVGNKGPMFQEKLKRFAPPAAWLLVIGALVFTVGKIIGLGFLPPDDALRHAAKAVSGKPWPDILVMRPGFEMDPYPGWHGILGMAHRALGLDTEALVILSVVALMLLYNFASLAWLRRPEAWLAALLVVAIFDTDFVPRMFLGRPFILTVTVFTAVLLMWSRLGQEMPGWRELAVTVVAVAAIAWIHGSFYQLILPGVALLLSGRWRQAAWFGLCWAAGSFLGASLTGHLWQFLAECVRFVTGALGDYTVSAQLVGEFRPSGGSAGIVLAVVAMILWRAGNADWNARSLINPLFIMGLLGWVLGLKVVRFWFDWGLPALLLWMSFEFQAQFEKYVGRDSGKRLVLIAGVGLAFFLAVTNDQNSRWTMSLNEKYLTQDNPELAGWLPDNGGIIYSADMSVFYNTFFKNPTAPWRYVVGFEPAIMQPEDLAVLHKVQWNYGDLRAYEPWVKKMRPEDRLIVPVSWLPAGVGGTLPGLEWNYVLNSFWIGRLQQKTNNAATGK
jgi:hypothetical protein